VKITNLREPIEVSDSNLAGSSFDNVNLQRTTFVNINFSDVRFNDVNMTNVRINAANTTGMTINDVDVSALVHACTHPGRFEALMPVLRVGDMQRAIDWYTGVLGFKLLWRRPDDGGTENCMLREGPLTLMLSTGLHLGGKPSFTGTLYLNMKGVAAFHESIKEKVDILWPLETMEYGTLEFGIRDPDGYTLAFAQAVR